MRIRRVVLSGIIAVGIIYMGCSWLTGRFIADNIDHTFYQLNHFLNKHQKFIKLESRYDNYRAGIFSTTLNVTIKITPLDSFHKKSILPSYPLLIKDKIVIYHGPLPWTEIKAFQFKPKIATITYQISKKLAPKLWALADFRSFLSAKINLYYNKNIQLLVKTLPINKINFADRALYNISNGKIALNIEQNFSKFEMDMHLNCLKIRDPKLNLNLSKLNINAHSLPNQNHQLSYQLSSSLGEGTIRLEGAYHNKESIKLHNLDYQARVNNYYENGFYNSNSLSIDNLFLNDKNIHIKDINVSNQNHSKNNSTVFGLVNYRVGKLLIGNQNFGYGNAEFHYHNLPVNSLNLLANYFVDKQNNIPAKDPIELSLNKLHWQNAQGTIDATLSAVLHGGIFNQYNVFSNLSVENIDKLDFSLKIPFNTLTYFLAQVFNLQSPFLNKNSLEDAYQHALLLTTLLKKSPALQVITPTQTAKGCPGIYSDLHYDVTKSKAKINDRILPSQYFFSIIKVLKS